MSKSGFVLCGQDGKFFHSAFRGALRLVNSAGEAWFTYSEDQATRMVADLRLMGAEFTIVGHAYVNFAESKR